METFSYQAKQEILSTRYDSFCCAASALCAVFQTLGEIVFRNGGLTISLVIDHDDMFDFVVETIEKFYGKLNETAEIHITSRVGNQRREWILEQSLGEKLLFDTGLVTFENGMRTIKSRAEKMLLLEDCCKVSYLAHAFCGSGTVSLPSEGTGGYHMEWSTKNADMAQDLASLLTEFGIFPKTVKRKDRYVVYLKDKDAISELLGRFGAVKSMLHLEEASAERDMRNRINRGANCMTANISKTVDAAARQLAAIETIEQTIGLDGLSPAQREIAAARKEDPSASIAALGEKLNIKKSAARQRLDALIAIAENLK